MTIKEAILSVAADIEALRLRPGRTAFGTPGNPHCSMGHVMDRAHCYAKDGYRMDPMFDLDALVNGDGDALGSDALGSKRLKIITTIETLNDNSLWYPCVVALRGLAATY